MIIKGAPSSKSYLLSAIVLLLSIATIFGFWYALPYLQSWKQEGIIYCDAEITRGKYFISHGNTFFNSNTQSNEVAFKGNFSSKINTGEGFQFGFGLEFNSFKPGKTYTASVWRKKEYHSGKSSLLILDNNNILNIEVSESIREKNDWEFLETTFTIPFQKDIESLRIYVRSDGKGIFYFDELKIIEKINSTESNAYAFQPEILNLSISEKAMRKLEQKRKEALQVGILQSTPKDWVNGTIQSSNIDEILPVELRLKGDWLDHLKNNKWSFRVKIKDPFAWRQLKTFSLQSPKTRDFLDEWVLHQWWKKEDVLTPRYDFVEVKLNGKSLGVYAYEEHFEKQLPESNARREGVIVRFSEEGFWADVKTRLSDQEGNPIAHVNNSAHHSTSEIQPFNEKQVLANPVLRKQLASAQQILIDFLEQKKPVSELFDIERMAKYFAICDLMHAQHSAAWHNMRFYFNPVLNKLEPVGFDGFPTYDYPYLLLSEGALSKHFKEDDEPIQHFFSDTIFLKQYIYNLFHFSEKDYYELFFNDLETGWADRFDFITKEFQEYIFNRDILEKRISGIRSGILPNENWSVKTFLEKDRQGANILKIGNTHSLPIKIIGTGSFKEKMDIPFDSIILLPSYVTSPFYKNQSKKIKKKSPKLTNIIRHQIEYQEIKVNGKPKYVFYSVLGNDRIFSTQIIGKGFENHTISKTPTTKKIPFSSNKIFSISNNNVIFTSGKYIITDDIIIPKGYKVFFPEGLELDFINQSKFLSYSPITMNGSIDLPIKIHSSDQTINGFTIIQSDETSELQNVIFENLNTHRKDNWTLTGAVTFYESEVNIENCTFIKSHSEDALNLIRSDFTISNSTFSDAFSDGLDLDFCNGSINNSKFQNTKNDGLDISGSNIYINNCSLIDCGDKAISVGEQSKAVILNATISDSNIAIASKDLSDVIIEKVKLNNCDQGFTAYQKKAEFGGSKIEVKDFEEENVNRLYNIRSGCELILKGKLISEKY